MTCFHSKCVAIFVVVVFFKFCRHASLKVISEWFLKIGRETPPQLFHLVAFPRWQFRLLISFLERPCQSSPTHSRTVTGHVNDYATPLDEVNPVVIWDCSKSGRINFLYRQYMYRRSVPGSLAVNNSCLVIIIYEFTSRDFAVCLRKIVAMRDSSKNVSLDYFRREVYEILNARW